MTLRTPALRMPEPRLAVAPFAVSSDAGTRGAFFDAWAEPFARTYTRHPALRERIAVFAREGRTVLDALGDAQPMRCLDLGCGPGIISEALADLGFDVVGVDRSETMIRTARSRIAGKSSRARMRFVCADLRGFLTSTRERYALVVSSSVLEYLDDPLEVLRRVAPRLLAGGSFAFSIPNPGSILRMAEPWIDRMRPGSPRCRSFWGNTLRSRDYTAIAPDLGLRVELVETFGLPRLSMLALLPFLRNRWLQTMCLLVLHRPIVGEPALGDLASHAPATQALGGAARRAA